MATIGKFTGGVNTQATITETALTGTVALSGGVPVVVGAGAVKSIRLGSIRDFLTCTIAVAGGVAGVFAYILK